MALSSSEIDALSADIKLHLAQTEFECASLTRLNGGTTNFVFRGILSTQNSKTVIVKHSAEFVSVNRNFLIDPSRCVTIHTWLIEGTGD